MDYHHEFFSFLFLLRNKNYKFLWETKCLFFICWLYVESWPIEDLSWYLGSEPKRQAPFSFNMTFILRSDNVIRSKERPHFGRTISFESRESYIKWIAAMMVAEHANDFLNNVITDSGASEEKLLLID